MSPSLLLKNVRGRVDYGIITIREDEFTAVFERLPDRSTVQGGSQLYEFANLPVDGGGNRGIAVVRCPSQGEGISQSVTGQMIRDLKPKILLLVGIAGGVPSDDFGLGDVMLASRLHDFSVTAALQDGGAQLNVSGGPLHRIVEKLIAHLPALLRRMPTWNTRESIKCDEPLVNIPADLSSQDLYGPEKWREKVTETLRLHFPVGKARRRPKAHIGPTASSNQLVKDANLVQQWQDAARSVTHIEMELAGVVQAARDADTEVPVIAIRGLSDIVGFRRDSAWTGFACHSAASFSIEMIKSRVIEEAAPWDWGVPGLMHGKVQTITEWLAGAPRAQPLDIKQSDVPTSKDVTSSTDFRPGILILGAGGVGKTTLGNFFPARKTSRRSRRRPLIMKASWLSRMS